MNIEWTSLVIGLIIGWLIEWLIDWFYWRKKDGDIDVDALRNELDLSNGKVANLETALAAARADAYNWEAKYLALEEERAGMATRGAAATAAALIIDEEIDAIDVDGDEEVDIVVDTVVEGIDVDGDGEIDVVLSKSVDAVIFEEISDDDLTLIQGIGPVYARKLHNAGIYGFAALAALSDDDLDEILEPQSFQNLDYDSFRSQANTFASISLPDIEGDNLQRIHGIGPEYDQRLRNAGITTYEELAVTDPDELASIIKAPAWRAVAYDAWLAQARLAADGDFDGLHDLQDHLFTGYGDNLLLIHGIGSNYNSALRDAGITTFEDLANSTPDQLTAVVAGAGLHNADFEAWIEEAKRRVAHKRIHRAKRSYENAIMVTCPQDLEAIEGVGVIYEQRLYHANIGSYWEVAQHTEEELSEILEVQTFQDVDLAGIRASATQLAIDTNSVNRVWDGTAPDDFEVLEGIGVVYERRLYNAGYCTYEALAKATVDALSQVCKPPQGQHPDFSRWINTAKVLAAAKGAKN